MAFVHAKRSVLDATVDVVIASGTSQSDEVIIPPGMQLAGILMPAAWTAAALTFLARRQIAETAVALYTGAAEVAVTTAAADRYIVPDPDTLVGIPYLTLRSGTGAVPVNQGAARTLKLVFRLTGR
jgi:hypothetical protein